jgi:hypothetical protein
MQPVEAGHQRGSAAGMAGGGCRSGSTVRRNLAADSLQMQEAVI